MHRNAAKALTALAIIGGCNPDIGLGVRNANPEAEITSHLDGAIVYEAVQTLFTGSVSDADSVASELTVAWVVGTEQFCEGTPEEDGKTNCQLTLGYNDNIVRLEVYDKFDALGLSTVDLEISPTTAPTITFIKPVEDGIYYVDRLISFNTEVSDGEDDPFELSVEYQSSLDGVLSMEGDPTPSSTGESQSAAYLSIGEHFITATVTDTTGKQATTNTSIVVGPANSAPTCTITAPVNGSNYTEGQTVNFTAVVDDVDIIADQLTIDWTSDHDGFLSASSANVGGNVTYSTANLTVASHTITLSVEDEIGTTCTDTVTVLVGTPPVITIDAPADGTTSNQNAIIAFEASVSDSEDPNADLWVELSSSLDGSLHAAFAPSSGTVQVSNSTLAWGEHAITATVTDTHGLTATDSITVTVNGRPSAPEIAMVPSPATSDLPVTVQFIAESVDPEGANVTYTYAWLKNGVPEATVNGSSLLSGLTTRDDVWTVTVTPNDGLANGPSDSATVTIINAKPRVTAVTITPVPAFGGDALSCSWTYADPDGDTDTSTVEWFVDGVSAGSGVTLQSGASQGQTVRCVVTPYDGYDVGTNAEASTVIGSLPDVSNISIAPNPAHAGDALTCNWTLTSPFTPNLTEAVWKVNGSLAGSGNPLSAALVQGDEVTCEVTPTNGTSNGNTAQSDITIANTPPVLSGASIEPNPAFAGDTLTCTPSATSDIDGTTAFTYTWSWRVDGVDAGVASQTISGLTHFQTASCTATPNDGTDNGLPVSSGTLTVSNTLPVGSAVTISPSDAQVTDALTCSWSFTDADGDSDNSTVSWTVNGSPVANTSTLSAGVAGAGDVVRCVVTPNDGYDDGNPVNSGPFGFSNSAPVVSDVLINPNPAKAGDTLTCSWSWFDDDGDADMSSVRWLIDGVPSGNSATLAAAITGGQVVSCQVTPNDGTVTGTPVTDQLTVTNSPPTLSAVTISPNPAFGDDTLTCIPGATTDPDGTVSFTYTWNWTVNGSPLGHNSATLTGPTHFQTVTCTATPNDGATDGAPATSSVLTISNTAPAVSNLQLSPAVPSITDDIICTYDYDDLDGDFDASTITWLINGSPGGAGDTLFAGAAESGDQIRCQVTADDGFQTGNTATSGPLTIGNTPPSVANLAITPNPPKSGDTLTCTWAFTDNDGDADQSTVAWLVNGTPSGTGASFDGAGLIAADIVTCQVTPYDGGTVGNPQSVAVTVGNTAPTLTDCEISTLSGQPLRTEQDVEATPLGLTDPDTQLLSVAYRWRVNGLTVNGQTSAILDSSFYSRGQTVSVVCTPSDGIASGNAITSAGVQVQNTPPNVGSVTLSPIGATSIDPLTAIELGWSDDDNDAEAYIYVWKVNTISVSGANTSGLPASHFTDGDTVQVTITPNDGFELGDPVTDTIVIGNASPTVTNVTIGPVPLYPGVDLECDWDFFDPEGDAEASTVQWYINGSPVGSGATLVDGGQTGDVVTCEVTPIDEHGAQGPIAEGEVLIDDLPDLTSVTISPDPAVYGDELSCGWTFSQPFVPDNSTVEWLIGGTVSGSGTTLSAPFVGGDEITCTVTPSNGTSIGLPMDDTLIISNTPPELDSVQLVADPAFEGDTLTCVPGAWTDVDGTAPSYQYRWTIGGVTQLGTNQTFSNFDRDDIVRCHVTPDDGDDIGDEIDSNSIVISNTAPVVSNVTVSPLAPTHSQDITCSWTYTDVDVDADQSTHTWYVNGNPSGSGVLSSAATAPGDSVYCEVTAFDGTDTGNTSQSQSVTPANSSPTVSNVSISPSNPKAGDSVTCTWDFADNEGDTDQSTVAWDIDGAPAGTNATLASPITVAGDQIRCIVTANDGFVSGSTGNDTVVVDNTEPILTGVTLAPNPVYEGDSLVCTPGAVTDPDNQTPVFEYRWSVNLTPVSETSNTLTDFDHFDTVQCHVIPNDTVEDGQEVSSNSVLVKNTQPEVSDVKITPAAPTHKDNLTCDWTYEDADSDTEFSTFTWFVNDSPAGTGVLLSAVLDPDDTVYCRVTAHDGSNSGNIAVSPTVIIGNDAPVVSNVTITPSDAKSGQTLTCSWSYSDNEGDPDNSTVSWEIGGSPAGTGNPLTTPGTQAGDVVKCIVSPNDGYDTGTDAFVTLTIANTAPSLSGCSVAATTSPRFITTANVVATPGTVIDPDSLDTFTYSYAWYVNDTLQVGASTDTLGSSHFIRDDKVKAECFANDGTDTSAAEVSNEIEVQNALMTLSSFLIQPSNAVATNTLTVTSASADADGDSMVSNNIIWYVGGVPSGSGTTLSPGAFLKGQEVYAQGVPNDGIEDGVMATSNTVTIGNLIPTAPLEIAITPDPTAPGDVMTCVVVQDAEDLDTNDTLTYEFTWRQNQSAAPAGALVTSTWANDTVSPFWTANGDEWECSVRAHDGDAYGGYAVESRIIGEEYIWLTISSDIWFINSDGAVSSNDDLNNSAFYPAGVFQKIEGGTSTTTPRICGINDSDQIVCFGGDTNLNNNVPFTGIWLDVEVVNSTAYGIFNDGKVYEWGGPYAGDPVPTSAGFAKLARAEQNSGSMCALNSSGFATCWGTYSSVVSDVPAVAFDSVAVGNNNACGIRTSDGGIECWGNPSAFESPPVDTFTDISIGTFRGCAVDTGGDIQCWHFFDLQPYWPAELEGDYFMLNYNVSAAVALGSDGVADQFNNNGVINSFP